MFRTFVMRPCMMRKCGLFTLSWTEWKRFCRNGQQTKDIVSNMLTQLDLRIQEGSSAHLHLAQLRRVRIDQVLVAPADHDLHKRTPPKGIRAATPAQTMHSAAAARLGRILAPGGSP